MGAALLYSIGTYQVAGHCNGCVKFEFNNTKQLYTKGNCEWKQYVSLYYSVYFMILLLLK